MVDLDAVAGTVPGAIDDFDYVDGLVALVPHVRPRQVPRGARLRLAGWLLGPAGDGVRAEAAGVTAVVDGAHAFAARASGPRPDITGTARGTVALGYTLDVPTDALPAGAHEVRVYVRRAGGIFEAGYAVFVLYDVVRPELAPVAGSVRIVFDQAVDLDADGATHGFGTPVPQGRYALLSGWALDARTGRAPAGVTATDGAGGRWNAPCSVRRPDIQAAQGASNDVLGYEIVVATGALARGRHTLQIRAYRHDGTPYARTIDAAFDVAAPVRSFPFFVREPAAAAPARAKLLTTLERRPLGDVVLGAASDVVVPDGATLTVSGWALDAAGARAADDVYVELVLDDELDVPPQRHAAVAGFRLDDPPRDLPAPAVDDAWFSATFTTDGLAARTYRARLLVLDRDARTSASAPLGRLTVARAARRDQGETGRASPGAGGAGSRRT